MRHALSVEQVAEAFELIESGVPKGNLPLIFNVSQNTMRRYLKGAEQYGMSFWTDNPEEDPRLDVGELLRENKELRERLNYLEHMLRELTNYAAEG